MNFLLHREPLLCQQNSVYTLFPFFTPVKMKRALTEQRRSSHYVYDRPPPPSPVHVIDTRKGILAVSGAAAPGTEPAVLNGGSTNGDGPALAKSTLSRLWRRSSTRPSAGPGPGKSADNAWASGLVFVYANLLINRSFVGAKSDVPEQ